MVGSMGMTWQQAFYGSDERGREVTSDLPRYVLLSVARLPHDDSEVWLCYSVVDVCEQVVTWPSRKRECGVT